MISEEEENEAATDDNNSSVHTEPCMVSSMKVRTVKGNIKIFCCLFLNCLVYF